MFILGLSSSPRIKGNSDYLLSLFLKQAEKRGFETAHIQVAKTDYAPCIGCGHCEKKGVCSIKDSLADDIFSLFRRADLIVLATPVYFYGIPARMKAIIDRSQTLWSRKYIFNINDPKSSYRKAVLLSTGATKGDNLFDGIRLTARYFFDALGAQFLGAQFSDELCYPNVDERGAFSSNPELDSKVQSDVEKLVEKLLTPMQNRKTIMFACRENAGRSQMAAAFARDIAGSTYDVLSAGSTPAKAINPVAVEVMAEKGLDIAFNIPCSIEDALKSTGGKLDMMVTMGCGENCPFIPGCKVVDWQLPDPSGQSIENVRKIRDEILIKVQELLQEK
ncbi:MAG: NAD(P)H-dependent oxidoreductase [Desulfamplus sp.]|nr:NAD(P)H-dependent oxidoreductase [Desulfamplus sp.]